MFNLYPGDSPAISVMEVSLDGYFGQLPGVKYTRGFDNVTHFPNQCCGARFEDRPIRHTNRTCFDGFDSKYCQQPTKGIRIIPGKIGKDVFVAEEEEVHEVPMGENILTIIVLKSHIKGNTPGTTFGSYKLSHNDQDVDVLFPYFGYFQLPRLDPGTPLSYYLAVYKARYPKHQIECWYERYTKLASYSAKASWQVYTLLDTQLSEFEKFINEYRLSVVYTINKIVNANYSPEQNPRLNLFVVKGN